MTLREIVTRAVLIAAMAGALGAGGHVMGWIAKTDAEVERASVQAYCQGVATWQAEAAQGIAPERRTGHPDYHGTADEQCPSRFDNQRQLASN